MNHVCRVLQRPIFLLAAMLATRVVLAQSVLPSGSVGVATYATVSQFKDLEVKANDQPLFQRTLSEGLADFEVGGGQWKVIDGLLQQSDAGATGVAAFIGDKSWTDYTVSVKARKVTGKEGFMLAFRAKDPKNYAWLNVGGWGNTRAQFELTTNGNRGEIGDSTNMKVDEDRWYDVKVDVKGDEATGYVDDKKVAWAKLVPPPAAPAQANRGGGNRGGGQGRGAAPQAVAVPIASIPQAAPENTLMDKLLFVGGTALAAGLVVVGVLWVKSRLDKSV